MNAHRTGDPCFPTTSEASVQVFMGLHLGTMKPEYIIWEVGLGKQKERQEGPRIPISPTDHPKLFQWLQYYKVSLPHKLVSQFSTWVIGRYATPKLWHWISAAILKYAKKWSRNTKKKWTPVQIFCVSQRTHFHKSSKLEVELCVFWEYTIQYTVTENFWEITILKHTVV